MVNFLASSWPLLLLLGVFFVMHRSGAGCGMHGGGHRHDKRHEHGAKRDGGAVPEAPEGAGTKATAGPGGGDHTAHRS